MPNQNAHSYSPSNISYHNKDIFSKIFSENMRNKSLSAYGLQQFLLCGLLVFTDKIISKQDSEQIWRWLDMTKVGRIFERELQKAVQIEVEKEVQKTLDVVNKEKQEALDTANKEKQEALKSSALTIARRMLTQGIPISTIQNIIPELTYSEINALTNPSN